MDAAVFLTGDAGCCSVSTSISFSSMFIFLGRPRRDGKRRIIDDQILARSACRFVSIFCFLNLQNAIIISIKNKME